MFSSLTFQAVHMIYTSTNTHTQLELKQNRTNKQLYCFNNRPLSAEFL